MNTASFSQTVSGTIRAMGIVSDVSAEVGLYSRDAFQGTPAQWDMVYSRLEALRADARGTERRSLTAALSRIWTPRHDIGHMFARMGREYRRAMRKAAA
tara:strand:- start:727 stop:1023 length:297 start_codon:yes stop_codon:yes gene_type:complete